jgi:hypothetical protein
MPPPAVPLLLEPLPPGPPLEPPLETVLPPFPELPPPELLLLLLLPGADPVEGLVPHDADQARTEAARTASAAELRSLDMDIHLPKGRCRPNRSLRGWPVAHRVPFQTKNGSVKGAIKSAAQVCRLSAANANRNRLLDFFLHAARQNGDPILYSPHVVG